MHCRSEWNGLGQILTHFQLIEFDETCSVSLNTIASTGLKYNLRKDLSGKNKASPGFFFDPATGTFKQSVPSPVPTVPSKYKFDNSYSNNRRKQENDAENTYNNPLLTSVHFRFTRLPLKFHDRNGGHCPP